MLVGVCDFPGSYAFPPAGYGGIERWPWAAAIGGRRAGTDVHLLGPSWRPGLGSQPPTVQDRSPPPHHGHGHRVAPYWLAAPP